MKPVYQHSDGTFGAPDYLEPGSFLVCEGLLGFHNRELSDCFDVRVYLDPPEELRRHWKVQRDCSRRGYTTDQVLTELDRREPDSERWIRPQRHAADIVVSFQPGDTEDQEHLDCKVTLCDSLPHPDLAGLVGEGGDGIVIGERSGRRPSCTCRAGCRTIAPRRSRRRSGRRWTSRGTCARSGSASSRSAPTCTAPTRSRSCSC